MKPNNSKVYRITGFLFIIAGILFNELTIKILSKNETKFQTVEKSIILIFIEIIIINIGIYIIIKKKAAIQNLAVLFISSFIFLTLLELILNIPALQNLSSDRPIWIPAKYKQIDRQIAEDHKRLSSKNIYGFNDINYPFKKEKNQTRIAVLGDSFIWGIGVPDSVIWTHKLQHYFQMDNINCKVMNWGHPGWQTIQQFNFLHKEGIKYEINYLIFAFVIDDPNSGPLRPKRLFYENSYVERELIHPIALLFPNIIALFTGLTENFLSSYCGYGYYNFYKDNIYIPSNLGRYSLLISEIKEFCQQNKIKFSFILTPENHNPIISKYFSKIEKILDENKIDYLNLYPFVENELKQYSIRQLWANPADGHPGDLVTSVYAKHVYPYLANKIKK